VTVVENGRLEGLGQPLELSPPFLEVKVVESEWSEENWPIKLTHEGCRK
jgi:hypothetical protein